MELGRAGPATAVIVDGQPYVFDFGPGVGGRISEAYERGIGGAAFSKVTKAFLTHHHSDHTSGLSDLFLSSWMFQRDEALHVWGPLGTDGMCRAIRSAYALDIAKRTETEPHARGGDALIGHDIAPGVVYRDDLVTVEAFDVPHGTWLDVHGPHPSLGYKITTPDRIVIVSGDTTWFPEMPTVYAGAHTIVHEVYSTRGLAGRSEDWQAYHSAAHTSGSQIAESAAAVEPEQLVLTHQLYWGTRPEDLVDEVSAIYGGTLINGADLDLV